MCPRTSFSPLKANMILRFLILVAYGCAVLDGGGISLENWLSETKCGIRYQYKDYLKSMINCSYVKKVNSLCRRDIVVVYSHWPPYCVTDEEGKASGILQGNSLSNLNVIFCFLSSLTRRSYVPSRCFGVLPYACCMLTLG